MRGPFTIQGVPMVLKDWSPEFNFNRDMLCTLPIWVKLPQLPLHMWDAESLGKIGSVIGKPLFTNECTANKLMISYARILVEIDVTQRLKELIVIKDNEERKFNQPMEYEWRPKFCDICQKVGHKCNTEKQKELKQWKAKEIEKKEDNQVK